MKTYIKSVGALVFIAVICSSLCIFGQNRFVQREFFSYERFALSMQILDAIARKPGSRSDIKAFAIYFNGGIYALSGEKYSVALSKFYKARSVWPEYYGTDFLIALTYERNGNIRKASRFYKGYLDKLDTLESGHFPISAPLINALNADDMDNYRESKAIIEEHLITYGIKLDDVKTPFFIAGFVKSVFIIFILIVLLLAGYYFIWPYFKKQNRIKNPPSGFWICRNCEEENPDPVKECSKCGRLRR